MALPKLSIIVPSYNQGEYIEETLLSIINQDYPGKELIVIDGGSTDNSVDIIKKYEQQITYWVSEKDEGQSHAINKGFELATGDYIAWMNSDDIYYENAFKKIFSIYNIEKSDFIFGPVRSGKDPVNSSFMASNNDKKLSVFNLLHFFYTVDCIIPSQSVFVKKDFLKEHNIGFLDKSFHYCMDMEWYCRIVLAKPKYFAYKEALSFFRINNTTKTGSQYSKMQAEAIQVFLDYRRYLSRKEENNIFRLLFLHRVLNKFFNKKIGVCRGSLCKLFNKAPAEALRDRRFLGLLKSLKLTWYFSHSRHINE